MFTQLEVDNLLEDLQDKSSVYSYLTESADTAIAVAETWYAIQGVFENEFENFELDTDKIKYTGDQDYKFEIDWHAKLAHSANSATINITISVNSVPVETVKMGGFAKTIGEPIQLSGTEIVTLSKNDTVQLIIESDKTGTVTIGNFVTSLNKFVIPRQ